MTDDGPTDTIDMVSLENEETVLLHLFVEGTWEPYDHVAKWLIQKLNWYVHFVASGQMAEHAQYRGRGATIVIHSERFPPAAAIETLARVRDATDAHAISLRLTVGTDVRNVIQLPDAM